MEGGGGGGLIERGGLLTFLLWKVGGGGGGGGLIRGFMVNTFVDFISGLHDCLEFSQPLSCLYQATRFLLLKYNTRLCSFRGTPFTI